MRMGAWPRHGSDADRGDAARRCRRARARSISAAVDAAQPTSPNVITLDDIDDMTGGPARYVRVAETGGRLGFITPMTHNFCEILQSRAPHPAPARCSCALARKTPPICAGRCGCIRIRRPSSSPRSKARFACKPKGMTSSSTAGTSGRPPPRRTIIAGGDLRLCVHKPRIPLVKNRAFLHTELVPASLKADQLRQSTELHA